VDFEITHELDAPIDALELALMSPELGPRLADSVSSLDAVEVKTHDIDDASFHRVWRFQARAPLKALSAYDVSRDMMNWEEHSTYRRADHRAAWRVVLRADVDPDAPWRRHFRAAGSYQLDALQNGRTRRTVRGEIAITLKVLGPMIERIAVAEIRKTYDAEADALSALALLP